VDLRTAQLQGADLRAAQLQGADLDRAQLQGADLDEAQLQGANLGGAQLQGATLRSAQLQGADLRKSTLYGAYLTNADLTMADLRKVGLTPLDEDDWQRIRHAISSALPEGRSRIRAIHRIEEAMTHETSLQPGRADGALYNPDAPEFAYMAEKWPPPFGDDELRKAGERIDGFVASLACTDEYVAKGIARRFTQGRHRTAARALLVKRDAVQAKPKECEGLKGISKETWARLQKKAGRAPAP
jgi:hypothetical protein